MIMAQEKQLIKAREEFEAMLNWINQAHDEGLRLDQIERGLFSRLLAIGLSLLAAYMSPSLALAMRGRRSRKKAVRCVVRPSHTGAGICRFSES